MISHKHKCVFIHIPKCGGQSVEHIFIKDNGLTRDTRSPLLLRSNNNAGVGPPRLAHLTYRDYINYRYASDDLMKGYYTFSIVRDPYKRVESLYRFLGFDSAIPFHDFVFKVLADQVENRKELYWFLRPQNEFVCDAAMNVCVDKIIKLEQINDDLPNLLGRFNIQCDEVPHFNRSRSVSVFASLKARITLAAKGVYSLSPFFNNSVNWNFRTREKVLSVYKDDFEIFQYSK
jgi:hypothetical protein